MDTINNKKKFINLDLSQCLQRVHLQITYDYYLPLYAMVFIDQKHRDQKRSNVFNNNDDDDRSIDRTIDDDQKKCQM
ncbi:hypothetical protein DERP_010289 [Dermatophagoides pteronyssinus]|uniref:Uncharacterized protein n=1 Tax=Dermatophagoides pteronyssinus TaxID=6956 RepID=A0ABQ8IYP0_DERPT|nr:hypothetical protein DERP_010289 [Dermatophagoides pteronyssinus]